MSAASWSRTESAAMLGLRTVKADFAQITMSVEKYRSRWCVRQTGEKCGVMNGVILSVHNTKTDAVGAANKLLDKLAKQNDAAKAGGAA